MSEYKRKTEKTHEVNLQSKINFCHWRKHSALICTEVFFDVSTEFIADGTEITISAKDANNKVSDTISDVITDNKLLGKYTIPENAEDNITLTARINDYSLSTKSSPLLVLRDILIDPANEHESMSKKQKELDELQYHITTDLKDERFGKVVDNVISESGVHLIEKYDIKFYPEVEDDDEQEKEENSDKPSSTEFINDVDPYISEEALKKKKSSPDFETLSDEECICLYTYTAKYYRKINPLLRGDTSKDENWKTVADDATKALEKLATIEDRVYKGIAFRGIEEMSDELVNKLFNVGEPFSDPAFMSSATEESEAFPGDVKITINSKTAVRIDDISAHPDEKEVLFKPNTQFLVLDKTKNPSGSWEIFIKEL
ncbi:MAG: hypothetical protein D6B28_02495 [Gammaproteobacteria bacterium]|nr:MAG: hypothetical protein D6B28_02495 [Gammaproteobacteria bacterium]